jgi:hypothetical protein
MQKQRLLPLPLRAQKLLLDQAFPGERCQIRGQTLEWEGWLTPSAFSRQYRIHVDYAFRGVPNIIVLEPDLHAIADAILPDRSLPHVYSQRPVRLCVYMPSTGEWHSSKALAATVLPWSIVWLEFFEEWVFTNVWSGGGIHPNIKPEEGTQEAVTPQESRIVS